MPRARAVQSPRGGLTQTGDHSRGYRLLSGSMGAPDPDAAGNLTLAPMPLEPGSDLSDEAMARRIAQLEAQDQEIAERAAHAGERRVNPPVFWEDVPPVFSLAPGSTPVGWKSPSRQQADLSPLPDHFAFEIERKGDQWKVTAPSVHQGLWVAGPDLGAALTDATGALAEILRLDGAMPVARRGRKVKP